MKLPQLTEKKPNFILLAFAFPFLGMLFVMLVSGYTPFGDYSMLYSDMYHQYYPFFVAFRKALRSGDSLLYSWNVGMGMDYLGLISYYLASPLNLLSVLVPQGILLEFFSFLVPLKLGFAGAFFALLLKKVFRRNDLSLSLFGSFYALCAWALGYQWNVMWLDSFALLPLVILGMISLLTERKFLLYTLSLFLAVAANYYIGLFVCIFVLLLFFCYEICRWGGLGKFFTDLGLMAVFSILAIGMTVFLELPALAALQTTQSSVNQFPEGFKLNIASENTWKGLLLAMAQVAGNMSGGLEPTFKEGLPNLYCGIAVNMLAAIYLTCSHIRVRDRICSVILLLFFNLSFVVRQLDYIWHGFHFTNMIPYRFSFLYSFVLLYMAYSAYLNRHKFKLWQIIFAGLTSVILILCTGQLSDLVLWLFSGGFILMYLAAFLFTSYRRLPDADLDREEKHLFVEKNRLRRQLGGILLLGFMAVELILNLVSFGIHFPGTYIVNYPKGTTDTKAVISYMHEEEEKDTLFYRAETTHSQTLNDGAINGYNGISAFTSSANVKTTEFMNALGYGAKNTYNRYCFEESSPVANLFLGLKYMIERDGEVEDNAYFDDVYQSGDVHLLKNNAYLPLGFLANSTLSQVNFFGSKTRFGLQNELFSSATGLADDVWHILGNDTLVVHSENVTIRSRTAGRTSYTGPEDGSGTLIYRYVPDQFGLMCVNLDLNKRNNYTVYKNGVELFDETHSLPQMISISDVMPGDVIEIHFTCKESEQGIIDVTAGILDEDLFRSGYEILSASTLAITHFENTRVDGTISCDRDGFLYTSIPQNGNWTLTVDGTNAEIQLIGDVMIGVPLTQGEHTVSFRYQNPAFRVGCMISCACLVILGVLALLIYPRRSYNGKYTK